MAISESQYDVLCEKFPLFTKIGSHHFEPKIWLIFVALKSGGVSTQSVSSRPCQSLMEHNVTFDQIGYFLEDLKNAKIFTRDASETYHLIPEVAYELHRICYEITKKIEKSDKPFIEIVEECGYNITAENRNRVNKFTAGDDNAKSEVLKDFFSQLAYAGAKLLMRCILSLD